MTDPQAAAPATDSDTSSLSRGAIVLLVAALAAAIISFQLNATMVAPAIRAINTQFGHDGYVVMSTYFYLAGAIGNVVLLRWSDYIGRKRVLLAVLVVLCIGTVLCITATSLPVLAVGRALQGFSNITYGLAYLILRERLNGPTFGLCCGALSSINGGVAGGDALLGGVMVDHFGYRSIFVLILLVGLAGLAFAALSVPADATQSRSTGRMDWIGAALISLTVGGLNMFFSAGGSGGWTSGTASSWLALAAVSLVALIMVESRIPNPLIAVTHMATRQAWPLIVVTILVMGSFMMVLSFIVPALAEDVDSGFGRTATATALYFLTPAALAQVLLAPVVGRFAVRIGFVRVLRTGLAAAVLVTALLAFVAHREVLVIVVMVLYGVTLQAVALTAMSVLGVIQASDEAPGALPGISNASYGIGSSLGFAWVGPIVGSGTDTSFAHAIWICAGIGLVALIFSFVLKPKPGPITALSHA